MSALTAFICGLAVGTLLMVVRVNAGYETGTNKEKKDTMKNIKNKVIGTTRRGKVVRLVGLLMLFGGAAFAAILIFAKITGTVTLASSPTVTWVTGTSKDGLTYTPTATGDGSGITCTPTVTGGTLNLAMTNALPGSYCEVSGKVHVAGSTELKVQDIDLTGVTVSGANLCGMTLTPHTEPIDRGPKTTIKFRVNVPQNASGNLTLGGNGLTAVPAGQYDAALCKVTG